MFSYRKFAQLSKNVTAIELALILKMLLAKNGLGIVNIWPLFWLGPPIEDQYLCKVIKNT
jgi:hypothetical protein